MESDLITDMSFAIGSSMEYLKPSNLEFCSHLGIRRIQPNGEGLFNDLYDMRSFFEDRNKWIIGDSVKDLFSLLRYHGINPRVRSIDVPSIKKLEPVVGERIPSSSSIQDLLYQINWFKSRLGTSKAGLIYHNLVEGLFPVISSMENNGLLYKGKKIYPKYNVGTTDSGRLSSTQDGEFFGPHSVKKIERNNFCPESDRKMILADHSASEMRVLAHVSGDQKLISLFEEDFDIHEIIARILFQKLSEPLSTVERDIGKSINFLIIFGGTEYGFSETAGIPLERARELKNKFFQTFPAIEEWVLETQIKCIQQGYIESIFGRTRIRDKTDNLESELRSMQNFCVQSPAADINSLSLRGIFHLLPKDSKILLHLHDGGVFSAREEDLEETCEIIRLCMEHPPGLNLFGIDFKVPLKAKIQISDHW